MHNEIIKTLLYFDIFQYPLTISEIRRYLSCASSEEELREAIKPLLADKKIFQIGDFYTIRHDFSNIDRRLKCNDLAQYYMPRAFAIAQKIQKFPFVLSVNLTGSISKNVMHADSDLDFFVITENGRLWIAKLFLVLYKKLILFNRKKNFCINYFISNSNLEIQERNIFTAIELISMIPVTGKKWQSRLLDANPWIHNFCKNFKEDCSSHENNESKPIWSTFIASNLRGSFGDALENKVMKMAYKRNMNKYSNGLSKGDFELMFRTNAEQAKVHNSNHQRKILDRYFEKIAQFESSFNMSISERN